MEVYSSLTVFLYKLFHTSLGLLICVDYRGDIEDEFNSDPRNTNTFDLQTSSLYSSKTLTKSLKL